MAQKNSHIIVKCAFKDREAIPATLSDVSFAVSFIKAIEYIPDNPSFTGDFSNSCFIFYENETGRIVEYITDGTEEAPLGVDDVKELMVSPDPGGLVSEAYDYISLSYTDDNLTGVVYKNGGSGGTTVATLVLGYSGSKLTSVTRT